jgi:hypothetical protein
MRLQRPFDCRFKPVYTLINANVVHRMAQCLEFMPEMSHCREEEDDFMAVVTDIRRLFINFGQQNDIDARAGRSDGSLIRTELISQNEY